MKMFGPIENQKFSADFHLLHKNIIKYCGRPFRNLEHMHKTIISNFNAELTEDDHLWLLGDVAMTSSSNFNKVAALIEKIKGHKHLVLGNHDEGKAFSYTNIGFDTVHTAMWFTYDKIDFFMAHDPAIYNIIEGNTNTVMLCGHVHTLFKHLFPTKKVINVGVDVWDFKPVKIEQIVEIMENGKGI